MLRATTVVRKPAVKSDRVIDSAWLDHNARQGHGVPVRSHGGLEFTLSLDSPAALNDGDALRLEDGRLIEVRAAPQPLIEIRAESPLRLLRLAWQLGQRHALAEFKPEAIYLEDRPILVELARGQGCRVTQVMRPFHPERADDHVCEHHEHHEHGGRHHDHRGHDHAHGDHGHSPGGHNHDHGHKHDH
jgi:urease accessory protein